MTDEENTQQKMEIITDMINDPKDPTEEELAAYWSEMEALEKEAKEYWETLARDNQTEDQQERGTR